MARARTFKKKVPFLKIKNPEGNGLLERGLLIKSLLGGVGWGEVWRDSRNQHAQDGC